MMMIEMTAVIIIIIIIYHVSTLCQWRSYDLLPVRHIVLPRLRYNLRDSVLWNVCADVEQTDFFNGAYYILCAVRGEAQELALR